MKFPARDHDTAVSTAADYLESAGFRILDRAWHTADGRLDIAAVHRQMFVACEVRTRSASRPGTPLKAVSPARRNRLRGLAVAWLTAHGVRFEQVRVDIIGLVWEGSGGYTIEHLRGWGK